MLQQSSPSIVLTIAGSDSSGGAGIQADIKTISALNGYAASVVTAITAQNTLGVQRVYPLPTDVVAAQIASVMSDLSPHAVKIGMVHNEGIVHAIASSLRLYCPPFIVYDPVMISTSGRHLMTETTIQTICQELLSLCTLITPNLTEASLLSGHPLESIADMEQAATSLSQRYDTSVLIKGGHLPGNEMCDVLCQHPSDTCIRFSNPKIESTNLHGTGCTLSSAIATLVAGGDTLTEAVGKAKSYVNGAISRGATMRIGRGNGPLWHFGME